MNTAPVIKRTGLFLIYSALSVLIWGCNPGDQQSREGDQGFDQTIHSPEDRVIALKEQADVVSGTREEAPESRLTTYHNEVLGVSFPLPENTQIQANDQWLTLWADADYQRMDEFIEATPLSIAAEENPNNLTVQEWVATQGYNLLGDIEEQTVGNHPGLRFTWLGMWQYTSVIVAHPNRETVITITWDNDSLDYRDRFEAIIVGLDFM